MATITTRAGKGSPLTNTEVDDNFSNLNSAKYESGSSPTLGVTQITGANDVGLRVHSSDNASAINISDTGGSVNLQNYGGALKIRTNGTHSTYSGSIEMAKFSTSGIVFNDGSYDADFRVESNDNANMLFVDGETNKLGIGTNAPYHFVEVAGSIQLDATDAQIYLKGGAVGTNSYVNWTFNTNDTIYTKIGIDYDTRTTTGFHIDAGYPITIDSSNGTGITFLASTQGVNKFSNSSNIFNDKGEDIDFRVESMVSQYTVFMDAQTGHVGFGDSTPTTTVDVNGPIAYASRASRKVAGGGANSNYHLIYEKDFQSASSFTTNQHRVVITGAGGTSGQTGSAEFIVNFKQQTTSKSWNIMPIEHHGINLCYVWDASGGSESAGSLKIYAASATGNYMYMQVDATSRDPNPASVVTRGAFPCTDTGSATAPTASVVLESPLTVYANRYNQNGYVSNQYVINERGVDLDFRVESNGNTHALFVEADGTGTGINTSDPQEALHVTGSIRLDGHNGGITSGEAVNQLIFKDTDTTTGGGQTMGQIDWTTLDANAPGVSARISGVADSSTTGQGRLNFSTGAEGTLVNNLTMAAGESTFNQAAANTDFRIETETRATAFYVDADTDTIYLYSPESEAGHRFTVNNDGSGTGHLQFQTAMNTQANGYVRANIVMSRNKNQITWDTTTSKWNHAGGSSTDWSMLSHVSGGFRAYTGAAVSAATQFTSADFNDNYLNYYTTPTGGHTWEAPGGGDFVFNDRALDRDFRVESDANANILFVDGGNNRVGIGHGTPNTLFSVQGAYAGQISNFFDTGSNGLAMHNGAAVLGVSRVSNGSTALHGPIFEVGRDNSSSGAYNIDDTFLTVKSNETVVNESSQDYDFRVESDSLTHALFVDGGNNRIEIGGPVRMVDRHAKIAWPDGGSLYATEIGAWHHIEGGYTNGDHTYWNRIASKGGTHIVLNTDGSRDSTRNTFDHFTIWQKEADHTTGRALFAVDNVGGVNFGQAGISIDRQWNNYPSITVARESWWGHDNATTYNEFRVHGISLQEKSWWGGATGADWAVNFRIDGGTYYSSDRRRKANIAPIENAVDTVKQLEGVEFQIVNSVGEAQTDLSKNGYKMGFIAQDVESVIPSAVKYYPDEDDGTDGYNNAYSVDYASVVALLTNAIKEQQATIDALEARINALEN